ncbi:cytochrome o ubiquinol oxidase subunit IV [Piscinibacter sakaiensis]|uniref:Cytochrome bo(3) ubiquinol oxidase subunit 4 n=1 Tax=Piscinibacter sakaiensis TaxID=1547922 RepID=A0A0K8NZW0_PISS1|nr:cytochrome o ubiquinol oxidase subunit IV [Piscinibacter sakaiensis]GAP35465.1 cytochrome O ubiquinol oxidase, subunit IV [Piscinibacter sakaiensis]
MTQADTTRDPAHGATLTHGAAHDEDGHDDDGAAHGTLRGYLTGFVLSVVLTAIPFAIVMGQAFERSSTAALVLLAFGAVQIVVHMVYFLHMNARSEGGWTMLALIFTLVLVVITLAGSLWVMFHLNDNMMPPMTAHPELGVVPAPR